MDTENGPARSAGSMAFTVLLWLLAGYILAGAFGFTYPANVAPLILGGIAFTLMSGLLVRELTLLFRARPGERDRASEERGRVGDIAPLACVLASAVVVILLGFLVGMSAAMVGVLRLYARERWATTFVLTAGVMLALYVAFGILLNVGFYPGMFGLGG